MNIVTVSTHTLLTVRIGIELVQVLYTEYSTFPVRVDAVLNLHRVQYNVHVCVLVLRTSIIQVRVTFEGL